MTVPQRKRLISIATFGTLLTLLVLAADSAGQLVGLERFLYDLRVRRCQYFTKPPTDALVHVDIDDGALAQVGPWPWPRGLVGEVVEEMHRAGAKLVVLDVLFSEPRPPELVEDPPGTFTRIDHDAELEAAIRRAGNVTLAASFNFVEQAETSGAVRRALVDALFGDLELEPGDATRLLAARGVNEPGLEEKVVAAFVGSRAEALYRRINRELDGGPATAAELRKRLTPRAAERGERRTVLDRELEEELERARTVRALRRFALPARGGIPPLIVSKTGLLPIARLADAAAFGGFVDYLTEEDGVVRHIPLAVWHEEMVIPQVSLVAACAAMGVDVRDVRVTPDAVVIPRAGSAAAGGTGAGELRIPTRVQPDGPHAGTHAYLDIPLFGRGTRERGGWQQMYDYPHYREPKARVPVVDVVAASRTRQRAERNDAVARAVVSRILRVADPGAAEDLAARPEPPAGEALDRLVADARDVLDLQLESFGKIEQPTEEEAATLNRLRTVAGQARVLDAWKDERSRLAAQLAGERARLAQRIGGRVAFVGSVSTGAADFVATSIDPRCPGVYLHSAAFNAIMTGEFWRTAPRWVTHLLTITLGLLTTLAVAAFDPPKAFASLLLLAGGYAAVNGIVLFDRNNLIVGAAGPLVTAGAVWSGVTLIQFVREIGERTRLTRRFRSYVDPTLVNYVIENPEQGRLEAREKELTVCFTDLQGFTTLAEKLRAGSAKVLGEYMEVMVPLIRARRGYVNKFLGDGIMFFFGSPVENPDHAADAVAAVLDMQGALVGFNARLAAQGLPTLAVRAGVSTGMMVVGDAGPSFASDYTVLGDAVNLAARLESANKAFGTANLITARTAELLGGRYLLRPVANLLVVGKEESCCVHEALAPAERATDEQRRVAAATAAMYDAFAAGRFDECAAALAELERVCGGPTKLTARYAEELATLKHRPPDGEFRGQIQLFAK